MAIYRATLTAILFGQTIQNVLHFKEEDATHTLTQVADEIDVFWIDQVKAWQQSSLVWSNIEVRRVDLIPAPAAINKAISKPGTGSGPTAAALSTTAVLLRLFTDFAGPHGRGRCFIGGVPIASYNLGILTSADLTSKVTQINNLKNRFIVSGHTSFLTWGIQDRSDRLDFKPLIDIGVRAVLSTQRRRNYNVGV